MSDFINPSATDEVIMEPTSADQLKSHANQGFFRRKFQLRLPVAVLFGILTTGLAFANLSLLRHDRKMTAALARSATMSAEVGMRAPSIFGMSLDRTPVSINFADDHRKTLVFVFSNECSVCRHNWPRWEALAKDIDKTQYRLVYVNISNSLRSGYLAEHHLLDSTVIAKVDPAAVLAYKLNLTPTLLLITPQATVEKVWVGMLRNSDLIEMQRTLGVPQMLDSTMN